MISGVGLGYLPNFRKEVKALVGEFSFLEIRPEDYFYGRSREELEELKAFWDLTLHGTEMSFLSNEDHSDYLSELKKVIEFTNAPWASEHLSWLNIGNQKIDAYIHPFIGPDSAKEILNKGLSYSETIGVPFHFENVANFINDQLSEKEERHFYQTVYSSDQSKMIFNLNSFLITSKLRGIPFKEYLSHYPVDRVESLTFVPKSCGNIIIEEHFGDFIMQNYEEALALVLKETSATSILVQRRYAHNTYENLKDILDSVKKIYKESLQ